MAISNSHIKAVSSMLCIDMKNGTIDHQFVDRTGVVLAIALSEDKKRIATGCSKGKVIIYDCDNFTSPQQIAHKFDTIDSLSFCSDDRFLAVGDGGYIYSDGRVSLVDVSNGDVSHLKTFRKDTPSCYANDPKNHKLYFGTYYSLAMMIDLTVLKAK